ncbi:putative adrenodoxin mitochondrial [Scophthalmus maximus]|uniref:Putative adrenodoxin mitochondrial n=1 Tax=Scophthalmus maximus TaxID=52904 RepID=A0A2U9AVC8_SCOMX|nr:putative adrenodoxin mitochondrial [Scophthalmus maximus]
MSLVAAVRRVAHVAVRDYSRRSAAARGAWLAGRRNFTGGSQPVQGSGPRPLKLPGPHSPWTCGTLACSTCHLIFDEDVYKDLGPVTDEELDMLDLAYGLTDTSRLGCQICLTKSLEGVVARVPESVADIRQSKDESV